MHKSEFLSDQVTQVISELVDPQKILEYESWTKGINTAARTFEGFSGVDVIRPRDHAYPEYVVIVKFDNYSNFRAWITSDIYREWIEKSRDLISVRSQQQMPSGMELWFTLPGEQRLTPRIDSPPYWKKVVMGILSVFPLILGCNILLEPLAAQMHPLLYLLVSVAIVSMLLTWPVMPWLTRILTGWLYPSVKPGEP
ncbi:MAG: antibiotic biosynthesis monooxygenase [Candidatus Wallbacteria bacterium HGW-Wallbacteria-1]|uniref:Antibiotic biosynthesis monooxygenase n=1 Tax=Candidatus Wallbacteria bacterium HGW-Wallbacteria-1 TaxID=2013854 RepID=A0A2N1PNF0_9BACT|nr:MAG: antibiotic biosynthesis monooxygenase [Candidatus Wallbacteria bacterium HGW-Wallbacteria-1]